jgi:hypothetical protein
LKVGSKPDVILAISINSVDEIKRGKSAYVIKIKIWDRIYAAITSVNFLPLDLTVFETC